MTKQQKTEDDHLFEARSRLVDCALAHVPFDGWSNVTFAAAIAESGLDPALARLACPRGVLDLALFAHRFADTCMLDALARKNLSAMRIRDRIALAVRVRIEAAGTREVVRRSVTFFAMPSHAAEGTAAIWKTCDLIWSALGDTSDDLNWYSKRAILSAVYSSTLLYWLGDDSEDHQATWGFLDRRIENVMAFERVKGGLRANPLVKGFMKGPGRILERIHAPGTKAPADMPGHWTAPDNERKSS